MRKSSLRAKKQRFSNTGDLVAGTRTDRVFDRANSTVFAKMPWTDSPGVSMIDRDRTFHRLMAAMRKRKAEYRHAREALAHDNLYPRSAALSRRVLRSEKVLSMSPEGSPG
jgi:hypothetical protein